MARRITKILLRSLLVAGGLVVVAGALAFWRLASGPVRLDFLTPYMEAAFPASPAGDRLDVGDTVLAWDADSREVVLRVRNLRIVDPQGTAQATLGAADVTLSLKALLRGILAVKTIEIDAARLELVRTAEGELHVAGMRQADAEGPGSGQPFELLLQGMLAEPATDRPIDFLEEIGIVDSNLAFDDRKAGIAVSVPLRSLIVYRHPAGLMGDIDVEIVTGGQTARIALNAIYQKADETIALNGSFSGLRPSAKAFLAEVLESLSGLDLALSGSITGAVGLDGAVQDLRLVVEGGAGTLAAPAVMPKPLPIRSLAARVRLDGASATLAIMEASVVLGSAEQPGARVSLSGHVSDIWGSPRIEAKAGLQGLDMATLGSYWPPGLADNARDWVSRNITKGVIEEGTAELDLLVPKGDFDKARPQRLAAQLRYKDLVVHYLPPLTPVTGVEGTARLDAKGAVFKVAPGARIGDIALTATDVAVSGLDTGKEAVALDFGLKSRARPLFELLDHPRVNLLEGFDIAVEESAGDISGRARLTLPLAAELDLDDVDVKAEIKSNRLVLGQTAPARVIENLTVALHRTGPDWTQVQVRGVAGAADADKAERKRDFAIDFSQATDGPYGLAVRAGDAGAMLHALAGRDDIDGGELTITGETQGTRPGDPMRGHIELKGFTAVKNSLLAKVLAASSFTGLRDLAFSKGISFDRLHGDFGYRDGVLESELLRAHSTSLKGTAKGRVDLDRDAFDVSGVIVPVEILNRVLGKIPVIKEMFSKDGGIVAINYKVTGPVDDPKIQVQTLKSLTPHFVQLLLGTAED